METLAMVFTAVVPAIASASTSAPDRDPCGNGYNGCNDGRDNGACAGGFSMNFSGRG